MNLKNCKGRVIKLKQTESVLNHFENNSNYGKIVLNQINESGLYDEFFHRINSDSDRVKTIVDVGANIGLFSLYAGAKTGYNVMSFEPTPEHGEIFKTLTSSYKNIELINKAVSNCEGFVDFYLNKENSTMNSLNNIYGNRIKVESTALDTFIDFYVDFLKIDIEGSEMLALTEPIINNIKNKIRFWFIEVHATFNKTIEQNRTELMKRFNSCGVELEFCGVDVIQSKIWF